MITIDKMNKVSQSAKTQLNGVAIAIACDQSDDNIMFCITHRIDADEYVVHLYNVEYDGFTNGYYTFDIESAYREFARRIRKFI